MEVGDRIYMRIYTAITNNRDKLKEQPPIDGATYDAFIDNETPTKPWNLNRIFGGLISSKRIKVICPFPDEHSLWIDGSIVLKSGLTADYLISKYLKTSDIAVFKHCHRYCVYQEAAYCASVHQT